MEGELAQLQTAPARTGPNIGRSLLLAFAIVGGMALTGADEILVSAPFIALREAFGFWTGFVASIGFWAALGLVTLILVDWVWPVVKPLWKRGFPQLQEVFYNFAIYFFVVAAATVVTIIAIFAKSVFNFLGSHLIFLGLVLAVVAGIFVLLITYEWLRERIESFVEFVPSITRQKVRVVAKLVAGLAVLVYMGPVLSRPFLIPLGVTSKGWAYILTFAAAPVYAGFWYPFYNLGVWNTIERILF